jgi:hypothetical protein
MSARHHRRVKPGGRTDYGPQVGLYASSIRPAPFTPSTCDTCGRGVQPVDNGLCVPCRVDQGLLDPFCDRCNGTGDDAQRGSACGHCNGEGHVLPDGSPLPAVVIR